MLLILSDVYFIFYVGCIASLLFIDSFLFSEAVAVIRKYRPVSLSLGGALGGVNHYRFKLILIIFLDLIFFHYTNLLSFEKIAFIALLVFVTHLFNSFFKKVPIKAYLLFIISLFLLYKLMMFQKFSTFHIVGLSFLVLKLAQYTVDNSYGQVKERSLLNLLGFSLFFPTFISGPIQRYQDFIEQVKVSRVSFDGIVGGIKRLIIGLFKIQVVNSVVSLYTVHSLDLAQMKQVSVLGALFHSYATVLEMYFSFAGYCDTAIGISLILGFKVPENFNYPLIARNMQDFWSRWNITFFIWIKKYLFIPISFQLYGVSFFKKRPSIIPHVAIFITFFMMGIWHGLNLNFVVYGVICGTGLATSSVWSSYIKSRKWKQWYLDSKIIHVIAILITFHYFTFSLIFANATSYDKWDVTMEVLRKFGSLFTGWWT